METKDSLSRQDKERLNTARNEKYFNCGNEYHKGRCAGALQFTRLPFPLDRARLQKLHIEDIALAFNGSLCWASPSIQAFTEWSSRLVARCRFTFWGSSFEAAYSLCDMLSTAALSIAEHLQVQPVTGHSAWSLQFKKEGGCSILNVVCLNNRRSKNTGSFTAWCTFQVPVACDNIQGRIYLTPLFCNSPSHME